MKKKTDPASTQGQGERPPRPSVLVWTWCGPEEKTAAHRTGDSVGCQPQSVEKQIMVMCVYAKGLMECLNLQYEVTCLSVGIGVSLSMLSYLAWMSPCWRFQNKCLPPNSILVFVKTFRFDVYLNAEQCCPCKTPNKWRDVHSGLFPHQQFPI